LHFFGAATVKFYISSASEVLPLFIYLFLNGFSGMGFKNGI
jgi:hypothetical protein